MCHIQKDQKKKKTIESNGKNSIFAKNNEIDIITVLTQYTL